MLGKRIALKMIFTGLFLVVLLFPLFQDEVISPQDKSGAPAAMAQTAPGRADDALRSGQAQTGSEGADSTFSVEKLLIGVGLFAVIILAVFRWGVSSRQKKQEQ